LLRPDITIDADAATDESPACAPSCWPLLPRRSQTLRVRTIDATGAGTLFASTPTLANADCRQPAR
jgi:hypothetical protein